MEPEQHPASVHDRLYYDFFERRQNHEQLQRQLEDYLRSQAFPCLSHYALLLFQREAANRKPNSPARRAKPLTFELRQSLGKLHRVSDSRLKVPEKANGLPTKDIERIFTMRREQTQSLPVSPIAELRKEYSLLPPQEETCPFIGKYYSQLSPVRVKVSYSSGCDVQKIVKGGKQMVNYMDARAMLAATQSTEP